MSNNFEIKANLMQSIKLNVHDWELDLCTKLNIECTE